MCRDSWYKCYDYEIGSINQCCSANMALPITFVEEEAERRGCLARRKQGRLGDLD